MELHNYKKRRKLQEITSIVEMEKEDVSTGSTAGTGRRHLHSYFCKDVLHKPAVVFDDGRGTVEEISYFILDNAANFLKDLLQSSTESSKLFVGVSCNLGVLYPALILGILRGEKAFYNIDMRKANLSIIDGVGLLNMRYILCHPDLAEETESILSNVTNKYDRKAIHIPKSNTEFYFYKLSPKSSLDQNFQSESIGLSLAYAIQTSGTTGKNKTVLVPHSCICPNVEDFIQRWKVTSGDIVFGSAPPTFDPHIVELFITLGTGATILYTTSDTKINGPVMAKMIASHHVSILQLTPSLFRRLSPHMNGNSLRLVAFGGEKCPSVEDIRDLTSTFHSSGSGNIVFQNVYGVTEMSCWASVAPIDINSSDPVTIGEGILETTVSLSDIVEDEGEIIISSNTRCCWVIDENNQLIKSSPVYHTGDTGKLLKEGGILFLGRKDRIVKRNGMKLPLHVIENMALSTGLFSYVECKIHKNKLYLLVQLKTECESLVDQNQKNIFNEGDVALVPALSCKLDLPLFLYPDSIIALKDVPVNTNGKVDFEAVLKSVISFENVNRLTRLSNYAYVVSRDEIINTLVPVWRSCTWPGTRPVEVILLENFVDSGGDSVSAARFIEYAFTALKLFGSEIHQKYEQKIIVKLFQDRFESVVGIFQEILTSHTSIQAEVTKYNPLFSTHQETLKYPVRFSEDSGFELYRLNSEFQDNGSTFCQETEENSKVSASFISPQVYFPIEFLNMHDFNLGLCVDASPAIVLGKGKFLREQAIIGCHGGWLLCVDLKFLSDNLSSCSSLSTAWKRKLPDRIESTVTIDHNGLHGYVGCHDGNFYKFNVSNGSIVCYATTVSNKPIRSQAALSDTEFPLAVFTDSANNIYCVCANDLNFKWVQQSIKILATATPVIYKKYCFINTLENGLVALDILSGRERWSCPYSDSINYSSPTIIKHFCCDKKTSTGKPQTLVLCEIADCNFKGLVAREIKNGTIVWRYDITASRLLKQQSLFQPFVVGPSCCNSILWLSSDSKISLVNLERVCNVTKTISTNFIIDSTVNPVIICGNRCEGVCECAVVFTIPKTMELAISYLHFNSPKVEKIKPWFMVHAFESFSKPVKLKEFILFGGRDNKLHIIRCKM